MVRLTFSFVQVRKLGQKEEQASQALCVNIEQPTHYPVDPY
jgi:hypothetical protein